LEHLEIVKCLLLAVAVQVLEFSTELLAVAVQVAIFIALHRFFLLEHLP
jgi:hypothetical protein